MLKKFKHLSGITSLIFAVLLSSCTTGLGDAVDIEAPVIKITSHSNMDYIGYNTTISGTCQDNDEVTEVLLTLTTNSESVKKKADVDSVSGTWTCSLNFTQDAEIQILAQAFDKSRNQSEKSVAYLTLIVDSQDPQIKSFYIQRNTSIPVKLEEKNTLETFAEDYKSSSKKYKFQNESITFITELKDNYRLEETKLSLLDEENNLILSNLAMDSSCSVYSARFTLTAQMLKETASSLSQGLHYLTPVLTVLDSAGNRVDYKKGSFIWWPESDNPKIDCGETEGKIVTTKKTDFHTFYFDDDGLNCIYAGLIPAPLWEETLREEKSLEESFEALKTSAYFIKKECNGASDRELSLDGADDAGNYYLVTAAEDFKSSGDETVWSYKSISVTVTSDDAPVILISSPVENTSAELKDGKFFTLEGYVLDNQQVTDLAMAWIPSKGRNISSSQIELAEKMISSRFDSMDSETFTDSSSGIKIYKLKAGTVVKEKVNSKTYTKTPFARTFDVTSDFIVNKNPENTIKTFVLYAKDKDSNVIFKTFRLSSYNDLPEINVSYWTDQDSAEREMEVITNAGSQTKALYGKITVRGQEGLSITKISGSIDSPVYSTEKNLSINDNCFELKDLLPDCNYTIKITAEDVFGNKNTVSKTIKTSPIPQLQKIYSEMPSGITLSQDETLTIFAQFEGSVKVTGTPKILLKNIEGSSANQYALYQSGSGGDTLVFTYKIPEGVYTTTDTILSTADKIILNGGSISSEDAELNEKSLTLENSDEVLSKESIIFIDALAPSVTEFTPDTDSKTLEAGTEKITIKFSEAVYKENGNIIIRRKSSSQNPWAIPIIFTSEEFSEVFNQMSDENKILMVGSSTGECLLSDTTGQPLGPYVKTTHGIKMIDDEKEEGVIPDTSTKYLLQFDLDPHDSTGIVAQLRAAFESINYHQEIIDVTSNQVELSSDKKTVTVKVPASLFADGREYEVLIDDTCFRDQAGNLFKGLEKEQWCFWTNKTAAPVIRVDRYTHGWGAREVTENGNLNSPLANKDTGTRPTGFVRVRIDSETNNASIQYGLVDYIPDSESVKNALKSNNRVNGATISPKAISSNNYSSLKTDKTYDSILILGDSNLCQAHRYYIKARARSDFLKDSDPGYEGAFKTVIFYMQPEKDGDLRIQGTDRAEGISMTAGFPLKDASPDERYEKYAYKIKKSDEGKYLPSFYKTSGKDWVLISYDFISDWYIQSKTSNWQDNLQNSPGTPGYGCFYYTYKRSYW